MDNVKECPIHNEEMVGREGKFGYFYSHKNGEEWCNGKVKGEHKDYSPRQITPEQNRSNGVSTPSVTKEDLGKAKEEILYALRELFKQEQKNTATILGALKDESVSP